MTNYFVEKYFIVFVINFHTNDGMKLSERLDVNLSTGRRHLKGFHTKRAMLDWITDNNEAIGEYQMLKPI